MAPVDRWFCTGRPVSYGLILGFGGTVPVDRPTVQVDRREPRTPENGQEHPPHLPKLKSNYGIGSKVMKGDF